MGIHVNLPHQMKKLFHIVFLFFLLPYAWSQLKRGKLIFDTTPSEVEGLTQNEKLNIEKTRQIADFITNNTVTSYKKYKFSKRKKAVLRHVKQLNEQLEHAYFSEQTLNAEHYEMLFELLLIQASLINDATNPSGKSPTFKKKLNMLWSTVRSPKKMEVTIQAIKTITDPVNSPYWNYVPDKDRMLSRFDDLAKIKKIKPKKELVVLFKSLSYSGSAPKIRTFDTDYNNEWSLKWGDEVHTDVVGSRIFSALGYDTDHPYFYQQDKLILVFEPSRKIHNEQQLCDSLKKIYNFDLKPFISKTGLVDSSMAKKNKNLQHFIGFQYVCFVKCAVEGRPDRVKRLGSFCPNLFNNPNRRELRASLLANIWIDNWDTREENTMLSQVHRGKYVYQISAVFSDLGSSMGVKVSPVHGDFKTGLVNAFDWEAARVHRGKIRFTCQMNEFALPYQNVQYEDLYWMATKIALFDEKMLRAILKESGWPKPIQELYFHKLASRRSSILQAFDIPDPNPIAFDRNLNIEENGQIIIKNGVLVVDYQRQKNPESFLHTKGRTRNYGN